MVSSVICINHLVPTNVKYHHEQPRYSFSGGPSISFYTRSDLSYKNLVVVLETQQLMIMTISKVVDGSKYLRQNKLSPLKMGDWTRNGNFITLPKNNISPENRPSQKESSLPTIHFQGLC